MGESPLSDTEIRIVRGMIDEYQYGEARRRMFNEWWKDSRAILGVFGAMMLLVMQGAELYLIARGR